MLRDFWNGFLVEYAIINNHSQSKATLHDEELQESYYREQLGEKRNTIKCAGKHQ